MDRFSHTNVGFVMYTIIIGRKQHQRQDFIEFFKIIGVSK